VLGVRRTLNPPSWW